ncbi:MAG: ABC transporter permease [Acidimicrobiia bacterium]|nr:ABC transporter permease [Acidimicrobiia bacterium]
MNDVVGLIVGGLALGCVYALVATGVVLTYKTSAVFNLALGAQAFTAAAVMYSLRNNLGLPLILSFVVAVLIVGPLLGLGLYVTLFRRLRNVPEAVRLVVALGVLILLPAIVQALWFGKGGNRGSPPALVLEQDKVYAWGPVSIPADQLSTILFTILVVVGLVALFKYTNLGLQMRAVVESPRMVQLAGINADRVSMISWMLSGTIAALGGVLLAPLFLSITPSNYTILLVAAIAAAVFGRLTSLPLTLVGGLALGFLQQALSRYLPSDSVLAQGLRPSLPFVVLFLLLLFWPGLRDRREVTDPLAGVDPPASSIAGTVRASKDTSKVLPLTLGTVVIVALCLLLPGIWMYRITGAIVLSTIFLSFTVLTGMAGQISLCQAAFAGAGAYGAAQLANHFNVPIMVGLLVGGLVGLAVGMLISLPTLGLRGIYLTLATLAFTLMVDQIVFPLEQVGGGPAGLEVPRPYWSGFIDFSDDRAFFLLCVAALAVAALVVWLVRRGTTGRFLDAIRGSETGAASIGINPSRAKITAFALSALIAGVGGVLLSSWQQRTSAGDFGVGNSLLWALVVIILGARTIKGALAGGFLLVLFPELLKAAGIPNPEAWQGVVFGLGTFVFVRHPEGLVDAIGGWYQRHFGRPERTTEEVRRIVTIDLSEPEPPAGNGASSPQAPYTAGVGPLPDTAGAVAGTAGGGSYRYAQAGSGPPQPPSMPAPPSFGGT